MTKFKVKIGGIEYPFKHLTFTKNIEPPDEFQIILPKIEQINLGEKIEIYREDKKVFYGLIENKKLRLDEEGENLTLSGRDLSQKLFHKITGSQTWIETKIKTIVQSLITETGILEGEIQDPFPVWHKWLQTTDIDFNNNTLTDTEIVGNGKDAKVTLLRTADENAYIEQTFTEDQFSPGTWDTPTFIAQKIRITQTGKHDIWLCLGRNSVFSYFDVWLVNDDGNGNPDMDNIIQHNILGGYGFWANTPDHVWKKVV